MPTRRGNKNGNKSKKKDKRSNNKKPTKKATWKKGQKMESQDVRLQRRKNYYQWPDLTDEEKQSVIENHRINEKSRQKAIARMQKLRKLNLGWEYIYGPRKGNKISEDELFKAINYYKQNRYKYSNWGGWNAKFGKDLSRFLIKEFKNNNKWKFEASNPRKRDNKTGYQVNPLLTWMDRKIRKCLEIPSKSKPSDFEWNSVKILICLHHDFITFL